MEHPYKCVHNTSLHYAELRKRGKVLAQSRNTIGSRSRGCGWSAFSLHAERAVVKRLGDLSKLAGCEMIVIRVNKSGDIVGSMPCDECKKFLEKCMRCHGLRKVRYS